MFYFIEKFIFNLYAGKKRSEPAGILAGVAGSVVLVLILSVFVFVRHRRRANKPAEKDHRE